MYIWRAYQQLCSGTDITPQWTKIPNLASRNHGGAAYSDSDAQVGDSSGIGLSFIEAAPRSTSAQARRPPAAPATRVTGPSGSRPTPATSTLTSQTPGAPRSEWCAQQVEDTVAQNRAVSPAPPLDGAGGGALGLAGGQCCDLHIRQRAVERLDLVHRCRPEVDRAAVPLTAADREAAGGLAAAADVHRGDRLAIEVQLQRLAGGVTDADQVIPVTQLRGHGQRRARTAREAECELALAVLQEERAGTGLAVLADGGAPVAGQRVELHPRRHRVAARGVQHGGGRLDRLVRTVQLDGRPELARGPSGTVLECGVVPVAR